MTATRLAHPLPIDVVLPRLARVQQTGRRSWDAQCPAHDDAATELAVTVSRDARVTLTCGQGCAPLAIVAAIGLEVADLYLPAAAAPVATEYALTTTNGSSPAKPAPAPPKRFTARVMANEDAEQAVLAAILMDHGGEACAQALLILEPEHFFADRHRLLFRAMRQLAETGTVIDPITLANTLTGTADLERAGGKDYIGLLLDAVPTTASVAYHARIVREWSLRRRLLTTMEATASIIRDGGADARPVADVARDVTAALVPITADPSEESGALPVAIQALNAPEPEPFTWCVEDIFIAGELAVAAGDGGSYKSTGAFHMAAAVAGGYSAFSRFKTEQRPALILSAEDGAGVILNRLDAIVAGHGWDRGRVLSNVHIIASHDAKLSSPAWQQHILAECARLDVGFVVCDPWADLISGDENSNSEQRPVIQFCRRIATQTKAAVLVIAHAAKVRENQRAIDRVRGAAALRDAARCVLFFESRPEGIAIEHLKMSRAEKLEPFTLTREIESTHDSRAVWITARFAFQSTDEAVLSRAETFVLDQVVAFPGALKSADLRSRGGAAGINYEAIAKAMTRLQARGLLDFTPGPKNAKFWTAIPQIPGSGSALGRLPEPAQYAGSASGRLPGAAERPSTPILSALPVGEAGRQDGLRASDTEPDDEPELELVDIPEEFDP